jgi:hypothetical protein
MRYTIVIFWVLGFVFVFATWFWVFWTIIAIGVLGILAAPNAISAYYAYIAYFCQKMYCA